MGRWNRGQSGNPRGRPKNGIAVAELRTQVEKHRLIDKLGNTGARAGEYANVDMDKEVRAIQLLLSYGYGPPRGHEIGGSEGILIQVVYAETNQIRKRGGGNRGQVVHRGHWRELGRSGEGRLGRDVGIVDATSFHHFRARQPYRRHHRRRCTRLRGWQAIPPRL